MSGYKPYKKNYFSQQKKRMFFSILIPVILIAITVIFYLSRPKISKDIDVTKPAGNVLHSGEIEKADEPEPYQVPFQKPSKEKVTIQPEIQAETAENSNSDLVTGPNNTNKGTGSDRPQQESEWKSDVDLEREQGVLIFEDVIRQCSDTRDQINQLQSEYDNTCTGTVYDAFGNPINKANTEECVRLMNDIRTLKIELQNNLKLSMENARKAGVYPGQVRDILQKYEFENL
jgi:hypothetical protein